MQAAAGDFPPSSSSSGSVGGADHGADRARTDARRSGQASPAAANLSLVFSNPLNLSLVDVGVDDRGNWWCYSGPDDAVNNSQCWNPNAQFYYDSFNSSNRVGYAGALFAAVDISYAHIATSLSDPAFKSFLGLNPRPDSIADVGIEIRYSLYNANPSCDGPFVSSPGVKSFEYSLKTRLRLWNSSAHQLWIWICDNSSAPKYLSVLNISNELRSQGINALEPGPSFNLSVPLLEPIGVAAIAEMKEDFCVAIWTVLDERCDSRIWVSEMNGAQLVFTTISYSNSRITRAKYLAEQLLLSDAFKKQYPMVNNSASIVHSKVFAPGPYPKLNRTSVLGCVSHYDCDDGLFCFSGSLISFAKGFRGAGGPGPYGFACDSCKYCLNDFNDPIDIQCPRDKCGTKVGSVPACLDSKQLFGKNFQCQSRYELNMSRIPPVPRTSSPLSVVPLFSPNSTVRKARFLTPYNQLVGAITVSQRRLQSSCKLGTDAVGRYLATKVPSLGPICRGSVVDSKPFGVDPAFSQSSSLYRGDVSRLEFYNTSEIGISRQPFGFFPHSYDGETRSPKPPELVMTGESDTFKLFFSEQLSASAAMDLVTYMSDGGFLDFQTDQVDVQIITLNANTNVLGIFTFTFKWLVLSFCEHRSVLLCSDVLVILEWWKDTLGLQHQFYPSLFVPGWRQGWAHTSRSDLCSSFGYKLYQKASRCEFLSQPF